MIVAELRRRRPEDAAIETLARISASESGGPALIEPVDPADRAWVEQLLSAAGVIDGAGRELAPADGAAYVLALPHSLRGSRLWAEEVVTRGD